jgi:hypothetical protein
MASEKHIVEEKMNADVKKVKRECTAYVDEQMPATHPPFMVMVLQAVKDITAAQKPKRPRVTRHAIIKYIAEHYQVTSPEQVCASE